MSKMVYRHHTFLTVMFLMEIFASSTMAYHKLLVIILDGLGSDYFKNYKLPGFKLFSSRGVTVENLVPVFPTEQIPNFYSLMTGVYPEIHGFVANEVYDVLKGESYNYLNNTKWDKNDWWKDEIEPFWATAAKQGRKTRLLNWYNCRFVRNQPHPSRCTVTSKPQSLKEIEDSLNLSINSLLSDEVDFVGLRITRIAEVGSQFGLNSTQFHESVKELDNQLIKFQLMLNSTYPRYGINILIISTLGLANVQKFLRITDIVPHLSSLAYYATAKGAFVQIWPKHNKLNEIVNTISGKHLNITVYKREESSLDLRFPRNSRLAPITVVADRGWFIYSGNEENVSATQGYDSRYPEMRGVLFARGPDIHNGVTLNTLNVLDVYNILCQLLDVSPSPNNGSVVLLKEIVDLPSVETIVISVCLLLGALLLVAIGTLYQPRTF